MLRVIHESYPVSSLEAIRPAIQLQFEMTREVFSTEYSKSCPAVRKYDPQTLIFPMEEYEQAVRKHYSSRTKSVLTLVVSEEEGNYALSCVAYLTLWPTVPSSNSRVIFRFAIGV
jgi:hypothetical protein